jgi:hypothetical protein
MISVRSIGKIQKDEELVQSEYLNLNASKFVQLI